MNMRNDKGLSCWVIKCWDKDYFDIVLEVDEYAYGNTPSLTAVVVEIVDGVPCIVEPLDHITVNLPGEQLGENCIFVDVNSTIDWEKFLTGNELAHPTGKTYQSGFVTYPEYKLSDEFVKQIEKAKEAEVGIIEAF